MEFSGPGVVLCRSTSSVRLLLTALAGESSVGTFMATFGIFHEVGHTMETGYDSRLDGFV